MSDLPADWRGSDPLSSFVGLSCLICCPTPGIWKCSVHISLKLPSDPAALFNKIVPCIKSLFSCQRSNKQRYLTNIEHQVIIYVTNIIYHGISLKPIARNNRRDIVYWYRIVRCETIIGLIRCQVKIFLCSIRVFDTTRLPKFALRRWCVLKYTNYFYR